MSIDEKDMQKLGAAIEFAQQDKNEEARVLFDELLQSKTSEVQVLYNAGIFFSQIGEHPRAFDLFEKVCVQEPKNFQFWHRAIYEAFQIGGGDVMKTDFMAFDPLYLNKARELCLQLKENGDSSDTLREILDKIDLKISQNRLAFKFCEGDYEYCRRTIDRKKEMTNLDERVEGFLNLMDSGEYRHIRGEFRVVSISDGTARPGGFLSRIRDYILGK